MDCLGLIPTVAHMSHWWHQEGNDTEISPVFKKNSSLYTARLSCEQRNDVVKGRAAHVYIAVNRDNLEWLARATNWAKFTATASLGVIHKVCDSLLFPCNFPV